MFGAYSGVNLGEQKSQTKLNRRNVYLDDRLERVEISGVQQIADRAFFRRGNRWIDGRSVVAGELDADVTITFGSDEYRKLLRTLIGEGRNGILSLEGEILVRIGGKNVLVVNDQATTR